VSEVATKLKVAEDRASEAAAALRRARAEVTELKEVLDAKGKELEEVVEVKRGELEEVVKAKGQELAFASKAKGLEAASKAHEDDLSKEKAVTDSTIVGLRKEKYSFESFVV
jgi:hypothetical protein